jgi:hypothetical protein
MSTRTPGADQGMTQREAAEFIAEHARELARIARDKGLDVLGYILEQAAEEATLLVKTYDGGNGGRQSR